MWYFPGLVKTSRFGVSVEKVRAYPSCPITSREPASRTVRMKKQ